MKKIIAIAALVSLISAPVEARHFAHPQPPHHRPAPTIIHKGHHKHHDTSLAAIVGGLAGFVIGAASAAPATTSVVYTTAAIPEQCFAVVSRSTGKVTQRCLNTTNGANEVIYVD